MAPPEVKDENKSNFPISILCKLIHPYSGERETLTAFLTNCQNALELSSEGQRQLIIKFIIAQLQGKAQIACSNKVFDSFDELKSFLKQNFGEKKHYNHLLLDLQSCKQQSSETVSQFALRIETCLTDLQTELHNSTIPHYELPGRLAGTDDLAMHTFVLGLGPRISNMVRCRNPTDLNSAINLAIEEEKLQKLLYDSKSKMCKVCNKSGHLESQCYFKNKNKQSYNVNYSATSTSQTAKSASPRREPAVSQSQERPTCRYCRNVGHTIDECRKRIYNNSRKHANSSYPATRSNHVQSDEQVVNESISFNNEQDNLN